MASAALLGYRIPCVLGVAGSAQAVTASLSPAMHRAAFTALGMEHGYYVPLALRESSAAKALRSLPRLGFRGANVTAPFKAVAAEVAHSRSDRVGRSGVANTLIIDRSGRIHAEATDGDAVVAAIVDRRIPLSRCDVVLLGAGGAAFDVAFALAEAGVRSLHLWNRNAARAETLALRLREWFSGLPLEVHVDLPIHHSAGVFVGAVPEPALEGGSFPALDESTLVVDLAYRRDRQPTVLCAMARAAGARDVDGREILARQGAASFALWLGVDAPLEEMRRAIT